MITELGYRLIHPSLTRIFTKAIVKHKTIVINPRRDDHVRALIAFIQDQNLERYLERLSVSAPNFLPKVHELNTRISTLLRKAWNLKKLDFYLDGHFVKLSETMPQRLEHLTHLRLEGESLYSNLSVLGKCTPNLLHLDLFSPCTSGSPGVPSRSDMDTTGLVPPVPSNTTSTSPPATGIFITRKDMPESLTHLHISNLNLPTVQKLLIDVEFAPRYFTFSLMHNYDLDELALLLSRDTFCANLLRLDLVRIKMVDMRRLDQFKRFVASEFARKASPVSLTWGC